MIFIKYVLYERRAYMDIRSEIEKKAYELYEKGGRADGFGLQHWLEAEKAVKARLGAAVSGESKLANKRAGTKPASKAAAPKKASKAAVTKTAARDDGKKATARKSKKT
jgi:hypothetical protein